MPSAIIASLPERVSRCFRRIGHARPRVKHIVKTVVLRPARQVLVQTCIALPLILTPLQSAESTIPPVSETQEQTAYIIPPSTFEELRFNFTLPVNIILGDIPVTSYNQQRIINENSLNVHNVPEPSTLMLFLFCVFIFFMTLKINKR